MNYFLLFMLPFLIAAGCKGKIRDDLTAISAKDANYPTAELVVNGKIANGLALTTVVKGDRWESFNLQVQGYYNGTITVTSTSCDVNFTTTYANNELVKIPISGIVSDSCVFGVVVSFALPKQQQTGVRVYPIVGWVAVKALPTKDTEWVGIANKGVLSHWTIKSGDTSPVRAYLNGCAITVDQNINPDQGLVDITVPPILQKQCVLDGVLFSKDYANLLLSAFIMDYDTNFVVLPAPIYSVANGKLTVTMDPSVSVVSLDSAYKLSNTAVWTFDPSIDHVVRGLTAKGRNIIGIYTKGEWSWIP